MIHTTAACLRITLCIASCCITVLLGWALECFSPDYPDFSAEIPVFCILRNPSVLGKLGWMVTANIKSSAFPEAHSMPTRWAGAAMGQERIEASRAPCWVLWDVAATHRGARGHVQKWDEWWFGSLKTWLPVLILLWISCVTLGNFPNSLILFSQMKADNICVPSCRED